MLLLGIDTETTGLDLVNDDVIELGAVVWDTDIAAPVQMYGVFVRTNKELSQEIQDITGIRPWHLQQYGMEPAPVLRTLNVLASGCKAVVAHNGKGFDFPLLSNVYKRAGVELPVWKYIDTSVDVPYPERISTRKLTHLAAEHGFLNPFAHRAVFDVLTMMSVLQKYDIAEVLALADEADITMRAMVGYEDREKAKARGYRWNGEKKWWLKTVKQSQVDKERKEADFTIKVLTDELS